MQFLLNLPPIVSLLLVCGVTACFAVGGLYLVRKRYPEEVLKENHEVAAIIFNAFGVLYAVVVAFVVFVTWTGYDDATKNLQMEASEAIDVFHSAEAFPEPMRNEIRQGLVDYANSVYAVELKSMASGEVKLHSALLKKVLAVFDAADDKSLANRDVYLESLRRVNDLAEYRRLRIFAGNNTMPSMLWLVLLVGGLITVLYTYFFGMKNIGAQYAMTAALTIMISLILLVIYMLDHPFTGANRVSIKPLTEAIELMPQMQ